MWNGSNAWKPWLNQELNYRPNRREPTREPARLPPYAVQTTKFFNTDVPPRPQRLAPYDVSYFGSDSWRSRPLPPIERPLPRIRPDFWTPRAVAQAPQQLHHKSLWNDFGAPQKPLEIKFLTWKSAKECGVRWQIPLELAARSKMEHCLKVYEKDKLAESSNPAPEEEEYRWKTVPGMEYTVEFSLKNNKVLEVAYGTLTFKATFSSFEMNQLLQKALNFCNDKRPSIHPFRILYRCKPQCYWKDIFDRSNGIMIKYIKDENGQAASPINGAIYGLFFSARLLPSGALPPSSPFGNIRMAIPAEVLLDPDRVNFYFSDFYCNKITHYVTIVICVKDSKTDLFCRNKLIPLNPDNPFISVVKYSSGYEFYVNKKVWVEIYYTESVPLLWGRFDIIQATGLGTSRIGGLPHNKVCTICNLYPITEKTDPSTSISYEDDEFEIESERHLVKMVNEMQSIGIPKEDCEDVVFLLGNLVDQVAYEQEYSVNVKSGTAIFSGQTISIDNALDTLNEPEMSTGTTRNIVNKIRNLHQSISTRVARIQSAILKRRKKLLQRK